MISEKAYISPDAKIGNDVKIEPFTTIYDDVEIGDGTVIGPNVFWKGSHVIKTT